LTDHIVLFGPHGVDVMGAARRLAEALALPLRSPDDFSDDEWAALGYDATAEIMAWAHGGAYIVYRLKLPMRLRAVEKLLAATERSVIVLPPDFVVKEDAADEAQLAALLATTPYVIHLTPSLDAAENARLLDADLAGFPDWSAVNAYWVRHPSNKRLAKHIVYTDGKTEAETRDDILALASQTPPADIILIGPKLTGKTTVGRLLADKLGLPQVSLDNVGNSYLAETDYDPAAAQQAWDASGVFGWLRWRRSYEAHMVERVLMDTHDAVIDFGGGHSVYEDEALFARVHQALAPYPNVFLILPSPDKDESIRQLARRFEADVASERQLQRLLVTHPSYGRLAAHTILTADQSPAAIQ